LPPALFTCGTEDPLLDDTVNMGVKWQISGGKALVKIYPGAPHAFIGMEREMMPEAGKAVDDTIEFIGECLGSAVGEV
jgi:acetyl esterase/lipase